MEKKPRKELLFFTIKIVVFYITSFLIISFWYRFFENYNLESNFFAPINKNIQNKLKENDIKIQLITGIKNWLEIYKNINTKNLYINQ